MAVEISPAKTAHVQMKDIISQLNKDELPIEKVIPLLKDESALIRANACLSVSRQAEGQNQFVDALVQAAEAPCNATYMTYTMGKRICDLAIVALLSIRTPTADSAVVRVVNNWLQDDRYDVLSWAGRVDLMSQTDLSSYYEKQHHLRLNLHL